VEGSVGVRITILGSGTSHGVPMIACDCPVCTSGDPRDRRSRTSALLSYDGTELLIDTGPELRLQCVAQNVQRVDAILYTHAHADHIVGLDDVRRFNYIAGTSLPVYGNAVTLDRIRRMFEYAFVDDPDYPSAKPSLRAIPVDAPFVVGGRSITPIPYQHGPTLVYGWRVGDIAYCPDCNFIPDTSRALLRDLDVLVLNALRRRPHPTHFNLDQAVTEAQRIGARQTYFTHIAHELQHAETNALLPPGMALAYDGLVCDSASPVHCENPLAHGVV
jgi:phosphoribosyl 1,2-cyclic phosphate phosphodiesterase